MSIFKKVFFLLILVSISCFSYAMDKPYLLIKVDSESLILDRTNIKNAVMVKNDRGSYNLDIILTPNAAKEMNNITMRNIGKTMSTFYGSDKLIGKSTIRGSLGDHFLIASFPEKEGKNLIDSLKK